MITVVDDFLDKTYFDTIKNYIQSENFDWYFQKNITHNNNEVDLNSFGFNHFVINQKESRNTVISYMMTGFLGKLIDTTKHNTIERCRIDMVTYSGKKYIHPIHIDFDFPHIASVFYITDSDAETIIYDKKCNSDREAKKLNPSSLKILEKIQPKENRILFFDGRYAHTGCSPSMHKNRIIINTDLINTL